MAVSVVPVVRLGVPVVEAAPTVHVRAAGHHVHTLRPAASCDARRGVASVADAGRHVDPVDRISADRQRQRGCVRGAISVALPTGWRGGEGVAPPGLVIDDRDGTRRTRAERILRGGVGEAARAQGSNVNCLGVRRALDLVKPAALVAACDSRLAQVDNVDICSLFGEIEGVAHKEPLLFRLYAEQYERRRGTRRGRRSVMQTASRGRRAGPYR